MSGRKRVADRVLTETVRPPGFAPAANGLSLQAIREKLPRAQRFIIDNVAQYVFVDAPRDWSKSDIPNAAPPFETFWMEWLRPPEAFSFQDVKDSLTDRVRAVDEPFGAPAYPGGVGVLFEATRMTTDERARRSQLAERASVTNLRRSETYDEILPADGGWDVTAAAFVWYDVDDAPDILGPLEYHLVVEADGTYDRTYQMIGDRSMAETAAAFAHAFDSLLIPCLFAISLCHVKNVVMVDDDPLPEKLAKAYRKRHGVPRLRFHQLHIVPAGLTLKAGGITREDLDKLPRSLHLRRGHFKTYDDSSPGLFGKHHGSWWWEAHAAGSIEEGHDEHEYVVHAPVRA